MTGEPISSLEWKTLIGFGIGWVILFIVSALSILFLRQTRVEDRRVEHTHVVIEELQVCLLAEREIETYARAFVLTGDNEYLQLYQESAAKLDKSLSTIQKLTADNPSQQRRIQEQLRPLVIQRLDTITPVIRAKQNAGKEAAISVLFEHHLLSAINDIRHVIGEMQAEERGLLKIRMTRHAESSHRLQMIILTSSAVALLFLFVASLLIHRDLRARQRIEKELRQSQRNLQKQADELLTTNKELEAFSYSVSHDLRAPLRGIEGFSQLIVEQYKDRLDLKAQGYFDRISAAARRMGVLIDEIIELARISRLPLQMQPVDLAILARMIVEDLQKNDPSREVKWICPDTLLVQGDTILLTVALTNLLSNAWKFTGKQPQAIIELGSTLKDFKTVYFVRDNGAGFDMAYENKLFQAFQRLHSAEDFPGIGIGLATVQRVILRHGGQVWAEGAVHHGATFYFTLS